MSKKRKTKSNKKRVASLSLTPSDIQTQTLPNGERIHKIIVESGYYQIGYENENGKLRHAFRSPDFTISHWEDEMNFDGHFCFVNTISSSNLVSLA